MQLGNDFSRVFSRQNQRFAVNINRLLNDTGVRQDHKDPSGLPPDRLPQQVRHDSRRLAGANRAVTGSKAVCNFRVTAGCIHLPAQFTSRVIAAKRHIHMTPADAALFGVADKQNVSFRTFTARPLVFGDTEVRVSDKFTTVVHLDYDEANACGFRKGDRGMIVK